MTGYDIFARYYDRLTENVGYRDRAQYFDALIRKHLGKAEIVLDLACGTGSLTAALAALGYDVIGVDGSPEMLSVAVEKLPGGLFLCQEMDELDLYGTVQATICALDSVNHVTDYDELCRIFARVALFTEPGGLFLFDVNSLYKHREVLGDNAFVYEYADLFCVWQNTQAPEDTVEITLDFFVRQGERYDRYTDWFCERAYPHEMLCAALQQAGMQLLKVYADDTMSPPDDKSQRLIYVAKKIG